MGVVITGSDGPVGPVGPVLPVLDVPVEDGVEEVADGLPESVAPLGAGVELEGWLWMASTVLSVWVSMRPGAPAFLWRLVFLTGVVTVTGVVG